MAVHVRHAAVAFTNVLLLLLALAAGRARDLREAAAGEPLPPRRPRARRGGMGSPRAAARVTSFRALEV